MATIRQQSSTEMCVALEWVSRETKKRTVEPLAFIFPLFSSFFSFATLDNKDNIEDVSLFLLLFTNRSSGLGTTWIQMYRCVDARAYTDKLMAKMYGIKKSPRPAHRLVSSL